VEASRMDRNSGHWTRPYYRSRSRIRATCTGRAPAGHGPNQAYVSFGVPRVNRYLRQAHNPEFRGNRGVARREVRRNKYKEKYQIREREKTN